VRLAALAVLVREDAARLQERLRLPNKDMQRLAALAQVAEALHGQHAPPEAHDLRLLFYRHADALADALAMVRAEAPADAQTQASWAGALDMLRAMPRPVLPWRGADVIAAGVAAGPRVRTCLEAAERLWIAADFPTDEAARTGLFKKALANEG
jgi:poly(A) polymerase